MKRKKGNADRLTAGAWWSRNRWSCVILAAALVLFIVVRMAAVTFEQPSPEGMNMPSTRPASSRISCRTIPRRIPWPTAAIGGAAAAGTGTLRSVQGRDHAGV